MLGLATLAAFMQLSACKRSSRVLLAAVIADVAHANAHTDAEANAHDGAHQVKSAEAARSAATERGAPAANVGVPPTVPAWQNDAAPTVQPTRTLDLAPRLDTPRFDVVGPVIGAEIAVMGSSQLGFVAVDITRGTIAWHKPAGMHLVAPLWHDQQWYLLSDCPTPTTAQPSYDVLGCLRVVAANGSDVALSPVIAKRDQAAAWHANTGPSRLVPWADTLIWQRRDSDDTTYQLQIDTLTGRANATAHVPPDVEAEFNGERFAFYREAEAIVALVQPHKTPAAANKVRWRLAGRSAALLGLVVANPGETPMLRIVRLGTRFNPAGELDLLDVEATGTLRGQAAFPTQGIALLGQAIGPTGAVVLAVRRDASLRHDLLVGYDQRSQKRWVHYLPESPRADPIGVAVTTDTTLAFVDGSRLLWLPPPQ